MSDRDDQFIAGFMDDYFAECDEHLASLRELLLALDGAGRADDHVLEELFLGFHSIKGISGMVELREAELLAHEMESYLRALRQGETTVSESGVDALIAGVEALEGVIKARRDNRSAPSIAAVMQRLAGIVAGAPETVVGRGSRPQAGPEWLVTFVPSMPLNARGINVDTARNLLRERGTILHASPKILQTGIAFEFGFAGDLDEETLSAWIGDGLTATPVGANLLTNAIKFSPSGGRITVSIVDEAGVLKLSVADSGEGISPEFLPHVFERFQQADPAANRRNAGLGLGLSLVRQLVELHGGRVAVTSTLGAGSTFTVLLPAHKDVSTAAGAGLSAVATAADAAVLAHIRVLVVAADDDEREMLSAALNQHGATVVGVRGLNDAVRVITAPDRPEVVVYSVPDARAGTDRTIETMQAIRNSGIVAIAITAEDPAEKAKMLALGFQADLSRPVLPPTLLSTVLGLARLR